MVFCIHLFRVDHPFDDALLVYNKGCTGSPHVFTSVHRFFLPYAKSLVQGCFCISNQAEGQRLFGDKALVRLGTVFAYPNNLVSCST